LVDLFESEKNLKDMIEEEDFLQQNDPEILNGYLEEIISKNYEQYEAYQLGKTELFNFFIGKMMSVTRGRSRPELIIKILRERLGEDYGKRKQ
jgi:Asp-tRNA(Asn)/Glu-tRNA(Gln) amidotransferase B subunit